MILKDQIELPTIDEGSSGGSFSGGGGLKKGPWTSAEDAILVEYVQNHGEGNWNAVQKHSGLSRCGKSCRLRWANHLKPNLKKGAFTADEEQMIIELHAKMGNKWARMAAHLPGRTDNEIKNYWNTRIKRRQRAGLPLYPPNVRLRPFNENQQNQSGSESSAGDKRNSELLEPNSYDIPDVIFDNFKADQGTLSSMPPFPVSLRRMLNQGMTSENYGFITPAMNPAKRLRESETLFPGFHGSGSCGMPTFEQFSNISETIHRPFGLDYSYDPDPGSKCLAPLAGAMPGSHALPNGNLSTSQPLHWTVKLELPSLQYPETDLSGWLMCPPTPPLEAVDAYIESPQTTVSIQSDCVSPQNSGMLEALLHQSQAMGTAKNQQSEKSSNSSTVMPNEIIESSAVILCNTDQEEYNDPISPLGCSAASVFSACTPPTSGSSLDYSSPGKTAAGLNIKSETVEHFSTQDVEGTEISPRLDFSRPDALLGSSWCSDCSKDHTTFTDAIATLLGEDYCCEYKHVPAGTSSAFGPGLGGLTTYPWNNMPPVHQMSELS